MNFPELPSVSGMKLALLVGYGVVAFAGGYKLRDLEADRYRAKVEATAAKQETARVTQKAHVEGVSQGVSQVSRDSGDKEQARIRTVYKTIQEKVPVYVPSPVAPGAGSDPGTIGVLPLGAVRLHDYAAIGSDPPVPAPSGEPLGAPSGVGLPAFVGTVAGNYGVCRGWRAEVMTWREWYAAQVAAWAHE